MKSTIALKMWQTTSTSTSNNTVRQVCNQSTISKTQMRTQASTPCFFWELSSLRLSIISYFSIFPLILPCRNVTPDPNISCRNVAPDPNISCRNVAPDPIYIMPARGIRSKYIVSARDTRSQCN